MIISIFFDNHSFLDYIYNFECLRFFTNKTFRHHYYNILLHICSCHWCPYLNYCYNINFISYTNNTKWFPLNITGMFVFVSLFGSGSVWRNECLYIHLGLHTYMVLKSQWWGHDHCLCFPFMNTSFRYGVFVQKLIQFRSWFCIFVLFFVDIYPLASSDITCLCSLHYLKIRCKFHSFLPRIALGDIFAAISPLEMITRSSLFLASKFSVNFNADHLGFTLCREASERPRNKGIFPVHSSAAIW